jgi:hypothetical protein
VFDCKINARQDMVTCGMPSRYDTSKFNMMRNKNTYNGGSKAMRQKNKAVVMIQVDLHMLNNRL